MRIFPKSQTYLNAFISVFMGMLLGAVTARYNSLLPALLVGIVSALVLFAVLSERYVKRFFIAGKPFPATWRLILESRVQFYRRLNHIDRELFEQDVRIFLSEQRIYGIRNQKVQEEIKILIAASAATLGFGLKDWEWPNLRDILVYPSGFDENYNIEASLPYKGMVHHQGPIIFSEEDLKLGFHSSSPGYNVGFHEMAHVLDMANGRADGVPAGMGWIATAPWVKIMADRIQKVRRGECQKILRSYAGANEAEFFAVAVEVFFEEPEKLKLKDPELFNLLSSYFGIDPEKPSNH